MFMKNKKTLIPIFLIIIFLLGGEFAKRNIFPYGIGLRTFLPDIIKISQEKKSIPFCPQKKRLINKLKFFSYEKIENIFIGDSVVDGAWSEKLFNLNYTLVAQSGATIDCLTIFIDYIKKIEPKNVIIYLGGNDADGSSNYGSDIGINYYSKFLTELKEIKSITKIYLIGINYSTTARRSSEYVKHLNDYFKNAEDGKRIIYIENFEKLDFREKLNFEFTYDGEHLRYLGYKEWFTYLSEKIDNFILE
jgi:hypothetical protein